MICIDTPINSQGVWFGQRCVTKINGGRREWGCAVSSQGSTSRLGDRDRNINKSYSGVWFGLLLGGVVERYELSTGL